MKTRFLSGFYQKILLLILIFAPVLQAQWSADSLQNLAIADTTGEQAIPKINATSDGGCYISWFDNRSGNYSVYLQRLNSAGEAQWTPNGLLISDHTQQSWLVDYDMAVDNNDNAVIVFADIRNGGNSDLDIFAYKIGPDGSFLWGADGIGLSDSTQPEFEAAPKVTATSSGNFVIAWQKIATAYNICFQKISETGQKMWGDNGINYTGASGHNLSSPDLIAADNDSVIAYWKNSTGPSYSPTTYLYTQKFAPDGSETWTSGGVLIYNSGHISAWTYPQIYTDENGGAFFTWHDSPTSSETYSWVQHVNSNGNLIFPLNGVKVSTNSGMLHWNPTLSYIASTDELLVFWVVSDGNQNYYGLYGQKFSPQGTRLWTDTGKEFIPLVNEQISFLNSNPVGTDIYICYFIDPSVLNNSVKAFKINANGNTLWGSRLLSSPTLGTKDDLLMVVNNEDRAFCTWCDERNGNKDIYAQNINPDGTLGAYQAPPPIITDLYINEFLAENDSNIVDPYGDHDDWIEIYNGGSDSIDIGGLYITDDLTDPTQWQIPTIAPDSTTIPPGGHLILWADKESEQGVLHVEIKLSKDGEQIGLYNQDGTTPIDTLSFGVQMSDTSYGRLPDGSNNWEFFSIPTPGSTNRIIPHAIFFDDFDSYIAGTQLCLQTTSWIPWGGTPGGSDDPEVSDVFSYSGSNSVVIMENDDLVKDFGPYTSGTYYVAFMAYIPTGKSGYFNTLSEFTLPSTFEWGMECYFNSGGNGSLNAGGTSIATFTWTPDTWQSVEVFVDLDQDVAEFLLDGQSIYQWIWTNGASGGGSQLQLDASDFFGADANAEMYIDDYKFDPYFIVPGINDDKHEVPITFDIAQNYPNPFNPTTTIKYQLPKKSTVKIVVYNLLGQVVRSLVSNSLEAGYYQTIWDGLNDFGQRLSTGVYFYRMEAEGFVKSHKMILMK